jgi:hypothetical protein
MEWLKGKKTYIVSAVTLGIQFCVQVGWIPPETGDTLTQAGLALIGLFLAAKINRKLVG